MGLIQQLALVSEVDDISPAELSQVAAALQKQLTRDFAPIWGVEATIDGFPRLEDVPPTYWPILIQADIHASGAAGLHEDADGQPFALVEYSSDWSLTASHEVLEMSADPFGNRLVQAQSLKADQGRVEYLVEVCDPSEAIEFGYGVNGVVVSDFYSPRYFDPMAADGVRYSFTGAITAPREVLRGGYLSWHEPVSNDWWQATWFEGDEVAFRNLGPIDARQGSLRSQVDAMTSPPRPREQAGGGELMMAAARRRHSVDAAASARASRLRSQVDALTGR